MHVKVFGFTLSLQTPLPSHVSCASQQPTGPLPQLAPRVLFTFGGQFTLLFTQKDGSSQSPVAFLHFTPVLNVLGGHADVLPVQFAAMSQAPLTGLHSCEAAEMQHSHVCESCAYSALHDNHDEAFILLPAP
jgi:hypothetical protein